MHYTKHGTDLAIHKAFVGLLPQLHEQPD